MTEQYTNHPAADLFPMMQGKQWKEFKEDIQQNGFQESVTLYKNQILDGRNRYKAAVELDMLDDLPICEIDDDFDIDPYQWVISRNLHRRHLKESQRALVAAKLAKLRIGEIGNGRVEVQICTPTLQQAAEQLDVGRTTVAHAKTVLANGSQELIEAVEQGKVAVSKAAKIANRVKHLQPKLPTAKWTAQLLNELCQCQTDNDAVRVAKKAIASGKKLSAKLIAEIRDSDNETGRASERHRKALQEASLEKHLETFGDILTDWRVSLQQIEQEQWRPIPKKAISRLRFEWKQIESLLKDSAP
jgi:hypothetical protein